MKKFADLDENEIRDFETIYNYLNFKTNLPESADAIVVGGAGSRTDMAERAAELFRENRAPLIIFSGFAHPDFGINEANLLADKTIELGVPDDSILRESRATNTGLNIILSANILREKGIGVKKIILVHRPFMTRRFFATAEKQWPGSQPKFYVTSANYDFLEYFLRNDKEGLAERSMSAMLKDYASIAEYPKLGFQSPQPFSLAAENAYNRLIARGFLQMENDHNLATGKFAME